MVELLFFWMLQEMLKKKKQAIKKPDKEPSKFDKKLLPPRQARDGSNLMREGG